MKYTILVAVLALLISPATTAQVYVGPANNPARGGTGAYYTFFGDGLIFDVFSPTTLVSVDIDTQGPGNVVVNLLDSTLTVLQTATIPVGTAGLQTVVLNFPLTPGVGYRLDATGTTTTGLYRDTAGAVFLLPPQASSTSPGRSTPSPASTTSSTTGSWAPRSPCPYPGTPLGDILLQTGVNCTASPFPWVKTATALDTISLVTSSPGGTYDYQPFVLLAQPFNTGFPPNPTLPGLGVWLDLNQPYVILINIEPFLTQVLNPGGTPLNFIMPFGFVGQSFLFQAACPTPAISLTDGYEIQVM